MGVEGAIGEDADEEDDELAQITDGLMHSYEEEVEDEERERDDALLDRLEEWRGAWRLENRSDNELGRLIWRKGDISAACISFPAVLQARGSMRLLPA